MTLWGAKVTIGGVPSVTEEELDAVFQSMPSGAVLTSIGESDTLLMTWRFENKSPLISDAVDQVSATWRGAVAHIESATDPVCSDIHVYTVEDL